MQTKNTKEETYPVAAPEYAKYLPSLGIGLGLLYAYKSKRGLMGYAGSVILGGMAGGIAAYYLGDTTTLDWLLDKYNQYIAVLFVTNPQMETTGNAKQDFIVSDIVKGKPQTDNLKLKTYLSTLNDKDLDIAWKSTLMVFYLPGQPKNENDYKPYELTPADYDYFKTKLLPEIKKTVTESTIFDV